MLKNVLIRKCSRTSVERSISPSPFRFEISGEVGGLRASYSRKLISGMRGLAGRESRKSQQLCLAMARIEGERPRALTRDIARPKHRCGPKSLSVFRPVPI